MWRSWSVFAAALMSPLMACSDGVSASLEQYADYFVPEDAVEVVTAPGLSWLQESFSVRRVPLEFAVRKEVLDRAQADGWTLCESSSPAWTEFDDATLTPPRHTKQKAYVLYKDGILVVLTGTYYIDGESALVPEEEMNQQGMVIVRNATSTIAQETATTLNLTCR
jgi:hypothetical protein